MTLSVKDGDSSALQVTYSTPASTGGADVLKYVVQYDTVAGFGSSMVFGTFVGSLADRYGRKRFAILYCLTYIASCATKHFSTYGVLMLGRLLGGIATSLLFSVFEAWLVAEHNRRGFEASWVGGTFSKAQFGNSLVAIAAVYAGGQTAPDEQIFRDMYLDDWDKADIEQHLETIPFKII